MSIFALIAILLTVTALLSWVNERYLRLPHTIGVMTAALVLSIMLTVLGHLGFVVDQWAEDIFGRIDFNAVLMKGMLSFLLFAGALHVDLSGLLQRKWTILSLATVGVLTSTLLVAGAFYFLVSAFGYHVPFLWALLFGALISPTDPIAVLGILKSAHAPESIETRIVGESLFNDGVGVVIFTLFLGFVTERKEFSWVGAGELLLEEAVGGAVVGLVLGYLAYRMLKSVDNYTVEVLITLALVSGGYALAGALHASGPIAMVVAGLFIGNHGRVFGMSDRTRQHLDTFWELIDEVLNALLFVMIGLELLVLDFEPIYFLVGALCIPLALAARAISVAIPVTVLRRFLPIEQFTIRLLTWAGVRGGISIALALALPPSPYRDMILVATYVVVIFSIFVQGLSIGRLVRWTAART
jgi:CPA1 family monovalent cation:H+ antiporter